MAQTKIEIPKQRNVSQMYHFINSQPFLKDYQNSFKGMNADFKISKAAGRRHRKDLRKIIKLAKAGIKESLKDT
ncbi:hypothetical protein [Emticicia sp.]|uniref:hypothetical protein n=1 Tax=Emticicia sp. TaxID=1930953 RepID=UPI0037518DBA